jgi:hypothetical protein
MLLILFEATSCKNQDIIQIRRTKVIEVFEKDVIQKSLECRRPIYKAKGHDTILIYTVSRTKRREFLILI